jgi:hypothetical protein
VVGDQSSVVPMREPFLKTADLSLSEKDFTLLGKLRRGWTEAAFEGSLGERCSNGPKTL